MSLPFIREDGLGDQASGRRLALSTGVVSPLRVVSAVLLVSARCIIWNIQSRQTYVMLISPAARQQ
ncbi:hypothetical protein BQ8794_50692 [Mesorhizobium prunaredense]|uniref:Uncharacterized protein n=1 Tax=Mesorhizobium prunaredense TaxID=1631249 RepID=A0A1R3VFA0_9HYPH|nr:hypothetical protein BQ8794_50692 [Mesorhizobium prunaredense]